MIGESLPEFVRCHTASFRSFSFGFFLVLPSVPSLPPAVQRREGDQTLESASPSSPSSPSSPASKNAAAAIEQGGGRKKSSRSSVRDRRCWVAAPELLAGGFSLSPRCCSPSFGSPSPEESFCRPQRRRRLQSLSHSSAGRKRRPRHPPTLPLALSLSQSGPNLDEGGTRSRGIERGKLCGHAQERMSSEIAKGEEEEEKRSEWGDKNVRLPSPSSPPSPSQQKLKKYYFIISPLTFSKCPG